MELEAEKGGITICFDIWPLSVTLTLIYVSNSSTRYIGSRWQTFPRSYLKIRSCILGLQSRQERGEDKLIIQLKRKIIIHIFQDFVCCVRHFQDKISLSYLSEVILLDEMQFQLDLALLTVFLEFEAFFLYSRAHNSHQN